MQLLSLSDMAVGLPPLAFTVGNFDGVHLGHQAILSQLKEIAVHHGLKTAVMFFEPQPMEFFAPTSAPPRISSWQEKANLIGELGIDYVIMANFDDDFRSQSAEDFAQRLHMLNVKHIMVGDDFRFGYDRSGDPNFLARAGFVVDKLDTVMLDDERISSTRIRECLKSGQLSTAAELLGRPYSISGVVERGDQIGRTIDFPTANVALNRLRPCLHGVYAVDVLPLDGKSLKTLAKSGKQGIVGVNPNSLFAAANIGTRPAIKDKPPEWRLEVHLPEFSSDLYGENLKVIFLHFLHGEKNYDSLDALKAGILDDVKRLKAWRKRQG